YRHMGEKMFEDFAKYCRTESGYAALSDVVTKQQRDEMESFVFAETFKYFYLLFAPSDTLDFDHVTLNTESHPLRRPWCVRRPSRTCFGLAPRIEQDTMRLCLTFHI